MPVLTVLYISRFWPLPSLQNDALELCSTGNQCKLTAYAQATSKGIVHLIRYSSDRHIAVLNLVLGLCFLAPLIIVAAYGRNKLFQVAARRFNRDPFQKERDGAFMASLMDSMDVRVGEAWYVLDLGNQWPLAPWVDDAHPLWRRSVVVGVGDVDFTVRLEKGRKAVKAAAKRRHTGSRSRFSSVPTEMQSQVHLDRQFQLKNRSKSNRQSSGDVGSIRRTGSDDAASYRAPLGKRVPGSDQTFKTKTDGVHVCKIPMMGLQLPQQELLQLARTGPALPNSE